MAFKSVVVAATTGAYAIVLLASLVAIQSGSSFRQTVESAALLFVFLACAVTTLTVVTHLRSWTVRRAPCTESPRPNPNPNPNNCLGLAAPVHAEIYRENAVDGSHLLG